jgi:pyruvate formate-lyase activating enzyme-like uncharacterized protein
MIKSKWTKKEVLEALKPFVIAPQYGHINPPPEVVHVIMAVERLVYNEHIAMIHKRQRGIKKLWQDDHKFLAIWNGTFDDLTNGCFACLSNRYTITHVRNAADCTQNCDFCYYRNQKDRSMRWEMPKNTYTFSDQDEKTPVCTLEEAKLIVDRQIVGNKQVHYGAVGWLQKEPLQEMESLLPLMEYIASHEIHQYLYTNGIFAKEENLKRLADAGLGEIRFNLQATEFSPVVIERMGIAKEYIKSVCIETPIYSKSYGNFLKNKDAILDTGLDQINTPELQACSLEQYEMFKHSEGPMYKHRRGYISPISSRHYVYDIIELAEAEKWDVVINDCSNDTKYYRGVKGVTPPGIISYLSTFELPIGDVYKLAEDYLDEEKTYEWF